MEFLEKIFSIKTNKNHFIFRFLGISLKVAKNINVKQIYSFYKNIVKDRTILIIEPNDCHYETLLGYSKYLQDLGYQVEILTRGNCYKLFSNNVLDIKIWECNKKTFNFIFKYLNFSKYHCLVFNSKRVYWKDNNESNDGSDIFSCFRRIPRGKFENIYVQHHLEFINDFKQEKQIILANPRKILDLDNCVVNPHFFGDVNITTKNENITKFITVGNLCVKRKNVGLLIKAVKELHDNNINNFEVLVVGAGNLNNIPNEIEKYFKMLGKLDFPEMFKALEEADFFLPLLDPENEKHQRYMKDGTSGSFQLIYGFLKPCIIHKIFADIYGFSKADSIIYEKNSDLYKGMVDAINLNIDKYKSKQEYLMNIVKKIEEESINNLKVFINEK